MLLTELCRFKVLKTGFDVNLSGLYFRFEKAFLNDYATIDGSNLCDSTLFHVYLSLRLKSVVSGLQ